MLLSQAGCADMQVLGQVAIPGELLTSYGRRKLKTLCRMTGFGNETAPILRVFDVMTAGWGSQRLGYWPEWKSDLSDDHTPIEFSLALDGDHSELHMLAEAQASQMSVESSWQAALELNNRLRAEFGVSLNRFRRVQDLFEPHGNGARFSMWHGACCRAGERPDFKLYLNPGSQGPQSAASVMREALHRLDFDHAWTFLERVLETDPQSRLLYFSLDLNDRTAARVKAYVGHKSATAQQVDQAMSLAGPNAYEPGMAQELCRTWVGHEGPFEGRPPMSCYAFTAGEDFRPDAVTFHFPIRSYCSTDEEAMRAIARTLPEQYRAQYAAAVSEFAQRPLEDGIGMQTYISVRKQNGTLRSTIYLATEAFDVAEPRAGGAAATSVC